MTSQACNKNEILLLLQILKKTHRIKCFDQFIVNKRDTEYFEHLHEKNTKLSANVSVSQARSQIFIAYTERREERRNSNRMGQEC